MRDLERAVHTCTKCHKNYSLMQKYRPVYSFGELDHKPIWVVGINPSYVEYNGMNGCMPYLSNSGNIIERRCSQLDYFRKPSYRFFKPIEKLFELVGVKDKVVKWTTNLWEEKIGFVDLVKCVTKVDNGQWSKLKDNQKGDLIANCEPYLKNQLIIYKPKLLVAYGKDLRNWFCTYCDRSPTLYGVSKVCIQTTEGEYRGAAAFINQPRAGGNFKEEEIGSISGCIVEVFELIGSPLL